MTNRHVLPSAVDVLERVLDKGIVIDAAVRLSVVGIDLATLEARVVVASLETYLKYVPRLAGDALVRAGSDASAGADREQEAGAVQIMREAFEALNGHDLGRYAALLDDGYVSETHGRPVMVRGREAGSHALDMYFKVLPDFHFIIEGAVAAHDDVLVSWLATGTPRAEYRRAGLTTRPLQVPGCTVTRIRDGKIVHAWNYWDTPTRGE